MLTAFDYSEMSEQDVSENKIKNVYEFQKELNLAKAFATQNAGNTLDDSICPACNENSMEFFYEKWGISYRRCSHCFSVKADVDVAMVNRFQTSKDLIDIRCSKEFQKDITDRREIMWEEFIDWLRFRCFRYLGTNQALDIVDYGNRYQGFVDKINETTLIGRYELRESILDNSRHNEISKADVVLCMDYLQQKSEPLEFFKKMADSLKDNGILVLRTRVGSGFDILTLRENNRYIYPFEHNFLPSMEGMQILLENSGYELMEMTTPGMFDVNYVLECKDMLQKENYFIKYLLDRQSKIHLADFQRFLQKSGMSSFAQVIARKKK